MPCSHYTRYVLFSLRHTLTNNRSLVQTGWGTRAGIGDASAATAAVDAENEKAAMGNTTTIPNSPYQQRQSLHPQIQIPQDRYQQPPYQQQYQHHGLPATPNEVASPFSDPVSPYRDKDTPTPNTPTYTGRQGQGQGNSGPGRGVSMRRRGEHEEVEMQVGFAR